MTFQNYIIVFAYDKRPRLAETPRILYHKIQNSNDQRSTIYDLPHNNNPLTLISHTRINFRNNFHNLMNIDPMLQLTSLTIEIIISNSDKLMFNNFNFLWCSINNQTNFVIYQELLILKLSNIIRDWQDNFQERNHQII